MRTKAILVNNPSNPCGTCFSKEHCLDIIKVADELKIPIIADEVYYGLVYGEGVEFHSLGNLTKDVPIIVRMNHSLFIKNTYRVWDLYLRYIACPDGDSDGALFTITMAISIKL